MAFRVALGKTSFSLEGAIGKPYGTTFEIDRSRLVPTVNESSSSTLLEGFESKWNQTDIRISHTVQHKTYFMF